MNADPSIIVPVADATKAVAETGGKALDTANAFGRFVKDPFGEVNGMVTDQLKYTRWERQVKLGEKALAFMASRGLDAPTRQLPLPFAVPLLSHALLEDDDELQDIWARLLVNAGDASTEMELRTAYVDILAGLTAFDVKNLAILVEGIVDGTGRASPTGCANMGFTNLSEGADRDNPRAGSCECPGWIVCGQPGQAGLPGAVLWFWRNGVLSTGDRYSLGNGLVSRLFVARRLG